MIIVFGGSFNPPTIAHYEVAKHVLSLPFVKQLLFVPVGDQYKKAGLIPAFHRVAMLEILINNLPEAAISKIEVEAEHALKSIETLERLQFEYPDSSLAFVMGADNLYDLINWYDYERLIREFKLIILNRGEFDVHAFIKENFECVADNFIIVDDFSKIDISSSAYRADTTRTEILLSEVENYIRENDLYRS
jgi:nicotinate-nucleotide adenylyltransferase